MSKPKFGDLAQINRVKHSVKMCQLEDLVNSDEVMVDLIVNSNGTISIQWSDRAWSYRTIDEAMESLQVAIDSKWEDG